MKSKMLLLLMGIVVSSTSFGQQVSTATKNSDSTNIAFQNKMAEMFAGVDLSLVPSGLLYDHGVPYITLRPFRGTITDSSKANTLTYGLVYASLTSMAVDNSKALAPPDDYMAAMDSTTINSTLIPIVGLHQEYYRIDSSAVEDSLFTVSGDNLLDVLPRPRSPYVKNEAFMLAPATDRTNQSNPSFFIDSTLFYTNTGKTIDSLLMDKGNGQGYGLVNFNQPIPVNFVTDGRKNFKIKIVYTDASTYETNFDINVFGTQTKTYSDSPDMDYAIGANPLNVGGTINVYLACGHERIEKPFIWAEAFNPSIGYVETNLTPAAILARLNHEAGEVDGLPLRIYLEENGYDLIVLDYVDGAAELSRTARFIEEAIGWVNTQKHSAGSNAKNVILGQSMGGVATMQALKEMENAEIDHECEKFIVFDSPIRGANIPMVAQASLLDMSTLWVNLPYSFDDRFLFQFVSPMKDLLKTLYTPATRTMITEQCDDVTIGFGSVSAREETGDLIDRDTESLFDDYYAELHDPSSGGMPNDCEVLVITNGSNAGISGKQPFEPGDLILRADIDHMVIGAIAAQLIENETGTDYFESGAWSSDIVEGGLGLLGWLAGGVLEMDIQFFAMKNTPDFKYYDCDIYIHPLWLPLTSPIVVHYNTAERETPSEYDHIPGGFFGAGVNGIFFPPESVFNDALSTFKMHTYCFTPTGSVLNYDDGTGYTWRNNTLRSFDDPSSDLTAGFMPGVDSYFAFSGSVTYDNDPASGSYKNTAHTWFREDQTRYLLYHLVGNNELDGITSISTGTTFNYGVTNLSPTTDFESSLPIRTSGILESSLTVSNAQYNVNANQHIGLTPSPYAPEVLGFPQLNSHFVLNLGPVCDDPAVILTLENNANMNVGDGNTRTGSVLVGEGHEIIVRSGAVLTIKSGSTVKLHSLAALRIENGGTVIIEDDASLIAEYGSTLHYYDGGSIKLHGGGSLLKLDGQLSIHENANFKPTHVGFGSGTIEIGNPDGTIIAATNSQFTLLGDNQYDPYLKLLENGKLVFPSNMDRVFIGSCRVIFRSEITEPVKSFTEFFTTNATYVVQDNVVSLGVHPVVGLYDRSYLQNNTFDDVRFYANQMVIDDGTSLTVRASDFDFSFAKNDPFIYMVNGNVLVDVCNFSGYRATALKLMGLTAYSSIVNSDFNADVAANDDVIFTVSESELYMRSNTFDRGNVGVHKYFGQLTLRCNDFLNLSEHGLSMDNQSSLEMSAERKVGYNRFSSIASEHIKLNNVNELELHQGYNRFNGAAGAIIDGGVSFTQPLDVFYSMEQNQWNASNTSPSSGDINVYTLGTPDEISYTFTPTTSGTCGQFDPSVSPFIP